MMRTIKEIQNSMKNLVLFRGTKKETIEKLNTIGLRDDCLLEAFEEPLPGNDFGFSTNLGEVSGIHLDFEIYMLPTNGNDIFIITEVNEFS